MKHAKAAAVRDAATVVLLRDSPSGLAVWLQIRVAQMVFAAGMAVFPGGRVEDADADLPFGPGADTAASRFGCEPRLGRALVGAAVRETFEETGLLFTVPPAQLPGARSDVEAGLLGFGELLHANDLVVDGEALHPWARWVTPAGEARRYDTRFFVGAPPDTAEPQNATSESSAAAWFDVGDALEQVQRGELGMLPPTIMTLAAVAQFGSVAGVIAAAPHRSLDPVRPVLTRDPDGSYRAHVAGGPSFALPRSMNG